LLTEEERRRKADELIAMIRELREPPMQPPPLVYRWEEAPDEPEPSESANNSTGRRLERLRALARDTTVPRQLLTHRIHDGGGFRVAEVA
jgi:hypothetical protein